MSIQFAACVIQNLHGDVLLLHRKTREQAQWDLPGAMLWEGESSEHAAARGGFEDLLEPVTIVRRLADVQITYDGQSARSHYWLGSIGVTATELQLNHKRAVEYINLRRRGVGAKGLSPQVEWLVHALQNDEIQL